MTKICVILPSYASPFDMFLLFALALDDLLVPSPLNPHAFAFYCPDPEYAVDRLIRDIPDCIALVVDD